MPDISILIPVFNTEKFLSQAIDSVINQSFTNWELIILDDNSMDKSYEIALSYSRNDSRISVFKNEENLGMVGNWNRGIDLCSSEFFIKLDSDDYWDENMLSKSIEILIEKPEVGLVFTQYKKVDENNNPLQEEESLPDFAKNKEIDCTELVLLGPDKMLQFNILRQGLSIMRRRIFDEIGKYKYLITFETQGSSDTEFYFRLGCHYKIYSLNETYYYYRIHNANIAFEDERNGLQDKKLYEIKYSIIKYYLSEHKINKSFYNYFLKANQFKYNFSRINKHRKSGQYFKLFQILFENLTLDFFKTLKFYFNRIKKKTLNHV